MVHESHTLLSAYGSAVPLFQAGNVGYLSLSEMDKGTDRTAILSIVLHEKDKGTDETATVYILGIAMLAVPDSVRSLVFDENLILSATVLKT